MKKSHKMMMCIVSVLVTCAAEDCLHGGAFLQQIRTIIGADPNVPAQERQGKPFTGSFSTVKSDDDPSLASTSYCMTDNACGHWDAYSRPDVPLSDLSCNSFCYIPVSTGRYAMSEVHTVDNPPSSYLSCGWETC